jgi:hypothetical protein
MAKQMISLIAVAIIFSRPFFDTDVSVVMLPSSNT